MTMQTFHKRIETCEKRYLLECLQKANNNVAEALRISGLARSQFYRELKKHNIELPEYGAGNRPYIKAHSKEVKDESCNLH